MAAAAADIIFSMRVEQLLSLAGARRVGVQYSYLAVLGVAVLLMGRGLHLLGREKVLRHFELVALPMAVVAALAAPFASYTYKRVSHPYTGFDMLTNKEVAEGSGWRCQRIPIAIILCCAAILLLGLLADMGRRRNAGLLLLFSAAIIVLVVVGVGDGHWYAGTGQGSCGQCAVHDTGPLRRGGVCPGDFPCSTRPKCSAPWIL